MSIPILDFISNGVSTFRAASRREYKDESEAIIQMRDELMQSNPTWRDDKKNLISDSRNVAKDMRKSYNQLVGENG